MTNCIASQPKPKSKQRNAKTKKQITPKNPQIQTLQAKQNMCLYYEKWLRPNNILKTAFNLTDS